MDAKTVLLEGIGQVLSGNEYTPIEAEFDMEEVYGLAEKHCVEHILSYFFQKTGQFSDADAPAFKNAYLTAVFADAKMQSIYRKLSDALEAEKIPYVPLKGMILRELYPQSWMRNSCDMDILVRKEDTDRAAAALINAGFTTNGERHFHDITFSCDEVTAELHFSICEDVPKEDRVLAKVWAYTEPKEGTRAEETPEFFVFHHIAHMCSHFIYGGCGIRPFADLWVLRHTYPYDAEILAKLLEEGGLTAFYRAVLALSDVWFGKAAHTELTRRMEKYILDGGMYGNAENNAEMYLQRRGVSYYIRRAFPPASYMRAEYPALEEKTGLLPFYYIGRIGKKTGIFVKTILLKRENIVLRKKPSQNTENIKKLLEMLKIDG